MAYQLHQISNDTLFAVTPAKDSSCYRNPITDLSFYNEEQILSFLESNPSGSFPFTFCKISNQLQVEKRLSIVQNLKEGEPLPQKFFSEGWVVFIIATTAFIYGLVHSKSKMFHPGIERFFLMKGSSERSTREISGLFNWQTTILNLVSFSVLGLFAFTASVYFGIVPSSVSGLVFWLICLGIISLAVTFRHFISIFTGKISGLEEVFSDYLYTVYQSYWYGGLTIFFLLTLKYYTHILPPNGYFITGISILGIIYLFRVIRLLTIFINRGLSIFYLILYLCALEILPVVISVKYFTGQV